ncbi:MAG: hypothetical protein IJY36_02945 [Coprobacter sp.]|nr:hypothetical protein [Coprobacter sp.]
MRQYIIGILCIFALSGCCKDESRWVTFIGDSEIARWDLQYYFPTLLTENMGLSGSGIKYLENCAGSINGRIAVVLCGTNDISAEHIEPAEYASLFLEAVKNLAARHTYIISVLPREFKGDSVNINEKIALLNENIKIGADVQGFTYIDIYPLLLKDGTLNRQYSYDGLHLNDLGYEVMSHELKKYLE